tara:strand:+ start:51 stop:2918 length:2868 start_codon:yes stop_codon:yes gene_type:complete
MAKLRVNEITAPIIKEEYTGSVYFDDTGDYLTIPTSDDFAFGTGDFTIEFFTYSSPDSSGNIQNCHIYEGRDDTNSQRPLIRIHGNTIRYYINGADRIIGPSLSVDRWYHIALCRNNGVSTLFVDGVSQGTYSDSIDILKPTTSLFIGSNESGTNRFIQGYLSNLRVCKGHAVYTDNFTVPTRELEVHEGPDHDRTVLLACQDAYNPTTEATGRHTITGNGHLSGDFGKNIVTNGDFTDGTTGWTGLSGATLSVENGKLKITESTGAADGYAVNGTAITTVVGVKYKIEWTFTEGTNTSFTVRFGNSGNQTQEYQSNGAAGGAFNDSGTYSFYFTATATQLNLSFIVNQASRYGYVSNVSVVAIAPISEANPGLLRKTNTTSTITETTGSVYFDGTSDGLRSNPYDELIIGTGAFTIECWFWRKNITDSWGSLVSDNLYSGAGGWDLYTQYNDIRFYVGGVGEVFTVSDCYSATTWTHVAVQRDSYGNFSCYINGVDQGVSATNSTNYTDNRILIGGNNSPAGSYPNYVFNGYISNVRVCKGHNVYTSNFAPPSRELEVHPGPEDDRTILLACYDGENIFAEKTGKIIAANGDRSSTPTPASSDSPVGSTTVTPGLTREVNPTPGSTFQGGVGFVSQGWLTLPKGTTEERFVKTTHEANPAPRGMRGSGQVAPNNAITNTMDSVEIATLGDAVDFGDLTEPKFGSGGIGSPTRGLFCGGGAPARKTIIEYFDIATRGNTQDFGDIHGSARTLAGATGGNATRGLTFGGATSSGTSNVICAITISSTGSVSDFGDCTKQNGSAVVCSPTRAVSAGGDSAANGSNINTIDFVTIQSMGNSLDFGDLLDQASGRGVSSTTRGLFSNENPAGKRINYVTIATTGNAVDFGDLNSNNASGGCASYSSLTRGCFAGLRTPATTNTIEYVTMSTLGDALNFGDLTQLVANGGGCSNGHGGLG